MTHLPQIVCLLLSNSWKHLPLETNTWMIPKTWIQKPKATLNAMEVWSSLTTSCTCRLVHATRKIQQISRQWAVGTKGLGLAHLACPATQRSSPKGQGKKCSNGTWLPCLEDIGWTISLLSWFFLSLYQSFFASGVFISHNVEKQEERGKGT